MRAVTFIAVVLALVAVALAVRPSTRAQWHMQPEALHSWLRESDVAEIPRPEARYWEDLVKGEDEGERSHIDDDKSLTVTRCIEIVDVDIPSQVRPDETNFEVAITAYNCGRNRWRTQHMQMLFAGDSQFTPTQLALTVDTQTQFVQPEETYTFYRSFDVSPTGLGLWPGVYYLAWQPFSALPRRLDGDCVHGEFGEMVEVELEVTCSDGVFCNGEERWAQSGAPGNTVWDCVDAPVGPCEDHRKCTVDVCDETTQSCSHFALTSQCEACDPANCVPSCDGRECGDDGCGGSCGQCRFSKQICNLGECMIVDPTECETFIDGSCERPLPLNGDYSNPADPVRETMYFTSNSTTPDAANPLRGPFAVEEPSCKPLLRFDNLRNRDPANYDKFGARAPEQVYFFRLDTTMGIDARVMSADFDPVLELRDVACSDPEFTGVNAVACNDNSSPPGNGGARIATLLGPGDYWLIVDGARAGASGDYSLTAQFTATCVRQCDGRTCGPDGCGGLCGSCGTNEMCMSDGPAAGTCRRASCIPECDFANPDWPSGLECTVPHVLEQVLERDCGSDRCGGVCGSTNGECVGDGEMCLGGACIAFETCDPLEPYNNPNNRDDYPGQDSDEFYYMGSDCRWYALGQKRPDLVPVAAGAPVVDSGVVFSETSADVMRGCVPANDARTLLRVPMGVINQGRGNFHVPRATTRPDLFAWSEADEAYALREFFRWTVTNSTGDVVAMASSDTVCVDDSVVVVDNPNTKCNARFECGLDGQGQGIQSGWGAVVSSSATCNFVDVTDLPSGSYDVMVEVNAARFHHEESFANNEVTFTVAI